MLVFPVCALAQAILRSSRISSVDHLLPVVSTAGASSDSPAVGLTLAPASTTSPLFDFFPPLQGPSQCVDDSTSWGDSIHTDPGDLHRIYFQNIDGLRNDADEMDLYVSTMAQLKVGTFCWADPGLDLSQVHVQQKLQRPINAHFVTARRAFSTCELPKDYPLPSAYQPGGTFMASTGRWATRSTGKVLIDPKGLGRWSGLRYIGKRGKCFAILTAYRSPRQQPSGGFGFYDQQYSRLLSTGIVKPNVRKQFITDLCQFVNDLQQAGYEILLSLDANETIGQDKAFGIEHLMSECSLTDLHCLGPTVPPATYKYGTARKIDYMLGSQALHDSVRHAGFLAYDDGIFSKHRGLFIDLDFQQLLGPVASIVPSSARRLKSEDQPSVDRYLEAFNKYAEDHKLWSRVKELCLVAPTMPAHHCKMSFDAIDRDVTRAMIHAEKLCRRPAGKYAWSPKLREAGLVARYWNLRLRQIEKGVCLRVPISALKVRLLQLHISLADDPNLEAVTIKERWKAATVLLRSVRNLAYDHRAVHLSTTLTHYENLPNSSDDDFDTAANKEKIKRIKRLLNTESMRKPFRTIHSSITASHGGGLSKLFVPSGVKNMNVAARFCNPDGTVTPDQLIAMAKSDKHSVEYDTILDCEAIEAELLQYNRNWFRQAKDTPFGHGPLFDLVGYDGLTEEATAIVSGHCVPYMGIPMSRELQVFLEECRRPDNVAQISSTISCPAFVKTVKAWKETTSTSPSGRHLGHYKTAILDARLTRLHVDLLNLPIACGFAPDRWTRSITPLLEKDDGKPYLTRLRVIHLFEADYNLFLKLIYGRRLVKNAETANALNDQQHGSRPRRMTTDALFLARLEKDLIRQTKANSAHMDNDATGCYDRIVTSLGMIACRRLGMPENAIRCQAETLRHMTYAVKHVYGVSSLQYESTDTEPLFGTGQGSGASPAIWLGLVVILLNALDRMSSEDEIPGLEFVDPWNDIAEAWRVGAFVDDTNQGVLDPHGVLSPSELVEKLRQAGQLWETLLHISGGCLNLAKCSWTLQYWKWQKGRPMLEPVASHDPLLLMTSGDAPEHHIIKRHSNETELKGLGVLMNFCGTFVAHAKAMQQKFDDLARRLSHSRLSPVLSRVFYDSFYVSSVKYSLSVTSMTGQALHKVQSKMTASILNKLGFNRHYPHAVVFAPMQVFGCGLFDLRIEQGLSHIQALLDYVGTDHKVGRVMLISLRHLQVEAGVSFDLLVSPQLELPYLTDCWLLCLRKFCADFSISIRVLKNRIPLLARDGDSCLMEKAMTLGFSKQELIDVNLVRTYLQVTTLSDIASAQGSTILPSVWNGFPISDRRSRLTFARQESPTVYQRGLWRRLLRCYLTPDASSRMLTLLTPVGVWRQPSNMIWGAMMWDDNLYRQNPRFDSGERQVSIHFPQHLVHPDGTSASRTFFDTKPDWYAAQVPRMAVPTDLQGEHILTAMCSSLEYPDIPKPAETFADWVDQLPPAERRLISSVSYAECDAEEILVQYLQIECSLFIGTDGGKRQKNGSFSWSIYSPGEEQLILNSGPVDGWHKCQNSLRSEAAALASVTLYLDELATFFSLDICCRFILYVDSTSAISNVSQLRDLIPKRRFANNADIFSIMSSAHSVITQFQFQHVKSHQDDNTDVDKLSFPARVNVSCDQMATAQLLRQKTHADERTMSCPLMPRHLPVEIKYNDQTISSHYVTRLREEIGLARHRLFLQNKYHWDDATWETIPWDSIAMCAKKSRLSHAAFRSKLVHNWLHLGAQRAKFGSDDKSSNPPLSLLPAS